MNIALISPYLYPCRIGGVEIFNYYLARELAKRGNKILLFSNCASQFNNENLLHVQLYKRILLIPKLSIDFSIFLNIARLKKEIEVLHVPYTSNSHLVYPILLINKIFGIPYIIVIHGGGMHPWKNKNVNEYFFQNADDIVAVSSPIKEEYERRINRRIKVIPPLIPFNVENASKKYLREQYLLSQDEFIILSLGSIKKIKGTDILIDAFISLGKEFIHEKKLKLLCVGDGPMKSELEAKINAEDLHENIILFGKVPHENVSKMYTLADAYVIPSLFEGTPISLLEAMFNGLPIIGTDVNGINSLINHKMNGLLFRKGDKEDLKEKIKTLVVNEELRSSLGALAKIDFLKGYTYEDVISDHIKLMEDIVEEKDE